MSAAGGKEPRRTPRGPIAGQDDATERVQRLAEGTPLAPHWTAGGGMGRVLHRTITATAGRRDIAIHRSAAP